MNIRAAMMSACAGAQARLQPKVGTYLRGMQVVDVLAVDGDKVRWQERDTGAVHDLDKTAFASRAVVALPVPSAADATPEDAVWAVASMKALPADQRLAIIVSTWPAAVRDAEPVTAWVDALRRGEEPTRTAGASA